MARTLSNNFELSFTAESSVGVAGTDWKKLEPNSVGSFGANIQTVARNPISPTRQRRKGTISDLDSAVQFEEDLTLSSFKDFIEGFAFATAVNGDVTDLVSTATDTTADTFAVSALSAGQAAKFAADALLYAKGFTNEVNNGLHVVDISAVGTDTVINVATNLATETAPATARLSFAGYRIPAASTITWDWDSSSKTATLGCTGTGTILTALGLTAGQFAHIGSPDSNGDVQNAFQNSSANDMYGYARVVSISANAVVFDKVDAALQFDDLTDPAAAIDILFGQFVRNVPTTHSDYIERSFQFEGTYIGLDTGSADMYSYAKGNYCNQVSFDFGLATKALISYDFVGTDTDSPVSSGSRKAGASSATNPLQTTAFNTTSDIGRLRITEVDETGITTDFKSVKVTLNNNVSPEKVIGTLGAKYMNTGNFEVNIESQLVFTNSLVVNKIRENETVTMDFIVKNDDGAIAIDIPSMTLGGGKVDLPVNQSILINTTGMAFQDATLGTSLGISIFPVTV